ncbi:hypothetical protein [Lentzea sp. NPDC092896]|uniref:hypothetical protein n=1 Tax=Lentzea sp. NPDC092896 TaxID=3364127 RepID=UPI0037F6838A
MTDNLDYTTWTFEDHITKAEMLVAEADAMATRQGAESAAALRRLEIQQTVDRGMLHAKLAELKKPAPIADQAPPAPAAADATTKPKPVRNPQRTADS